MQGSLYQQIACTQDRLVGCRDGFAAFRPKVRQRTLRDLRQLGRRSNQAVGKPGQRQQRLL